MTDENEHVRGLKNARYLLLQKRRLTAANIGTRIDGEHKELLQYQEAIEAIDRAIADEERLAERDAILWPSKPPA